MCTHRRKHSIFCILPPHILREIAKNTKDDEQRAIVLNTLALDQTSRTSRMNQQFMAGTVMRPMMAVTPTAQRSIFTAANSTGSRPSKSESPTRRTGRCQSERSAKSWCARRSCFPATGTPRRQSFSSTAGIGPVTSGIAWTTSCSCAAGARIC